MAKAGFDTHARENWIPCGHQQVTGLNTAKGLTAPATKGPVHVAVLKATTQNVRFRDDGTDPTASVGILLATGDVPYLYRGDLSAIKFIETTASAVLDVSYYQIP